MEGLTLSILWVDAFVMRGRSLDVSTHRFLLVWRAILWEVQLENSQHEDRLQG